MSLWISDHNRHNRNVCTYGVGLVIVKDYLRIVWTFSSSGVRIWGCDSQSILVHDGIRLALRTTGTEMLEKDFKEGSVLVYWLLLVLCSKFRGWNFFKEGRTWNSVKLEGQKRTFPCLMRGNLGISTSQKTKFFEVRSGDITRGEALLFSFFFFPISLPFSFSLYVFTVHARPCPFTTSATSKTCTLRRNGKKGSQNPESPTGRSSNVVHGQEAWRVRATGEGRPPWK